MCSVCSVVPIAVPPPLSSVDRWLYRSCFLGPIHAITQQTKNGSWTQMPASPSKRRIAMDILGVKTSSRGEQHLNGLFATEGRSPMKRCFSTSSDIAHKRFGCHRSDCRAVGILSRILRVIRFEYFSLLACLFSCKDRRRDLPLCRSKGSPLVSQWIIVASAEGCRGLPNREFRVGLESFKNFSPKRQARKGIKFMGATDFAPIDATCMQTLRRSARWVTTNFSWIEAWKTD